MQKIEFTRIAKFRFNNNYYQMFKARRNKIAFLKINEKGQYEFPSYREFTLLVRYFMTDRFDNHAFYRDERHKKYKFIPYIKEVVKGKTKLVMITSMLVLTSLTGCATNDPARHYSYNTEYEPLDIEVSSSNVEYNSSNTEYRNPNGFYETDDFELLESSKMITLYNNKYYDKIFGVDNYTTSEVILTLNENKNVPDNCRECMTDFINVMDSFYQDLDFRVFNYNLSTLDFEIRPSDDVDFVANGTVAFYDITNNKMIINEDIDLKNDPRSRLIFRHELGHLFNHLKINFDGYDIKSYFNDAGRGKYLKEALDVIFTTEPFLDDYPDKVQENMGYPITTNIVKVLLECMDYTCDLSISNNVYYFQKALNEANPYDIDARVIEEIIELQWMEYSDNAIRVDNEEYYDLYGYIARLYINKKVDPNMTYDEIIDIQDDLISRLLIGVKDESMVITEPVYEEFQNYLERENILSTSLNM